ncbi:response regulator [Paenibacillus koleovorans]|uniref:response regulator n=1 Tax=Paenibacillus koleovorans TaxID=121608 RepID=UPI000FDA461B|nr:response regulator [Paenibacillus koleovorans]
MNILVVEDEELIRNGLIAMLQRDALPHARFAGACNGIEALELARTFEPDLVITDITMPAMSGLEFIREAKARQLCRRFIIMTGYNEFEYAKEAIRYQVIEYLLKPINKAELITLVRQIAAEEEADQARRAERISELVKDDGGYDPGNGSKLSAVMRHMVEYVQQRYKDDLSLQSLQDVTGLHPNYISALFKKELGMTFLYYLNSIRIKKSVEYLIYREEKTIHEIAERVGYYNERQFFRAFKKFTGLTPGEFRNRNGKSTGMY